MQCTSYIKFASVVLDTSILRLSAVVTDKQLPTFRSQAVQDGLDVRKNLPVYAVLVTRRPESPSTRLLKKSLDLFSAQ